jgi:hypothetical protein
MEAPEKIWINPSIDLPKLNGVLDKESIEYTRTDAFIEKACVKLKKLMYDNLMFQGRLHREEVIDNFVEDFKKYMEG